MRGRWLRGLWRTVVASALVGLVSIATMAAAHAQSGDSSKHGDVAGNLPFAIYLLIPLGLVLALVTAIVLGERGDPEGDEVRAGGITRALGRRGATPGPPEGPGREAEVS
jgi:hypothetical protein